MKKQMTALAAAAMAGLCAFAGKMNYLYSDKEQISSGHDCEVVRHPYLSDGGTVATAKAGEKFGPLAPGSYLIKEKLAPGKVRTRYLGVAAPGWTVVQCTCGTTGDKLDSVFHSRRIPMNYYAGLKDVQQDTTFLGWQRDYGDAVYLHLHPNGMGYVDPKFKTLKENWEEFTVPEIVERLKALDAWMRKFGFEAPDGFASYTPANSLIEAMREMGWDVLHSIVPEQNWSDGHWAINHWGMPNQPFYIADDDFRKSTTRGGTGKSDVLGMSMNSYHLYMPHVVMWGDNVCSPSHFLRWHRTVESGDAPVRYENFLNDYLKVAEGMKDSPYFLITGYEFGRNFGTRSMTVHNRAGAETAIDKAKNGGKVVFATARDVADWYGRFCPALPESVFTQRDYLAGTRIMDKPINSGPSIGMEMKDYKACFAHLSALPYYHYDYTIRWKFKAADVKAPHDFAEEDRKLVKVERMAGKMRVEAAEALPRITPVCVWDAAVKSGAAGMRTFTPPVLDDGREHTCVELPKGWKGVLELALEEKSAPPKAEFEGLAHRLWRVQEIGEGARRHAYVYLETPLLSPCAVEFTVPAACRIDSLEKPLGEFKAGDKVRLEFSTRRTWYRFWGLKAEQIQPDAAAVAAIEKAEAEWKEFSQNAKERLAEIHKADDEFFKTVPGAGEKLLLDMDCFGNAVFGERSRALPFDRCVYRANGKVTAKEYSDGGISFGKGKSFWVHPRGLSFRVEGLDTLGLAPTARLRVRLCTVADKGEKLSYLVKVRSGWNKMMGWVDDGQEPMVWDCPEERTKEGLYTFDVKAGDLENGELAVVLRTNQKQVLDDWFADGGFISRLERLVVTQLPEDGAGAGASFAEFDRRAKAGERLTVAFFGGSLTWSANATDPDVTGFRGLMADYFQKKYPTAHFKFVDASIGGTGSTLGMFRLERDVMAHKPDLVFLDFACNDGGENTALLPTCCYEYLIREMVGRGVPVQQMYFTFKNWSGVGADPAKQHPRRDVYLKIAEAYGTPVGDVYQMDLWKKMHTGEVSTDTVWPIDGGHPDDIGYRMFADAGIAGYEKALREGAVCRAPAKPLYGTVKDIVRTNPAEGELPAGWKRKLTYRTSLWFDGLSSRWMGDVAAFSGAERSPLKVKGKGNFFGVFGEADEKALMADVTCGGKKVTRFRGYHGAGQGRLFIWRNWNAKDWEKADGSEKEWAVDPVPSAKGDKKAEFRVGSFCTATVVPAVKDGAAGAAKAGADALEKLDHARGK